MNLQAKRSAPPEVLPVRHENYEFRIGAETCDGSILKQVLVWSIADKKLLKRITVYRIKIDPNLETDVQDVCIATMKIERNILLIINEHGNRFYINHDTLALSAAPQDTPTSSPKTP